ncbi:MAG: phosphate/phosphite/phosphonate ABC transporter substrate-binding protein [Myxococcota bacterium]|nr:phosphate/phosphite/phosphonate ABC transporter substrate-binding protein [Myxococcota bacterium]
MRFLWLLLLVGCGGGDVDSKGGGPLVETIAPPLSVIFEKSQKALDEAGIDTLRWGLTPYMAPQELYASYQPIAEVVGDKMGVEIELVMGETYADLEGQVVRGEVDVAVVSPYSYVRAKKSAPGLRVFASHVAKGSANYGSYIIVGEESELETLEDLRGKTFAFVDRRSTSGYLFPAIQMLRMGVHPEDDIKAEFYQTHDRVFDAVVEGRVAAGATYDGALRQGRDRRRDGRGVRVIAKAPRIPHEAYVIRQGLPVEVADAFGAALAGISTGTREGRALLAPMLRINGFIQVEDSHYDAVRRVEAQAETAGLRMEAPSRPLPSEESGSEQGEANEEQTP